MTDFQIALIDNIKKRINHVEFYVAKGGRDTFRLGDLEVSMVSISHNGFDISEMVRPLEVYFSVKEIYDDNLLQASEPLPTKLFSLLHVG